MTVTGIMFLCEAACGQMHTITRDDSSLRHAPAGCDSVKAVGRSAAASRLKEPLLADSSAPRSNAAASEAERATRRDERLAVVGVVVIYLGGFATNWAQVRRGARVTHGHQPR